jgi:hypothetical protein
MHFSIVSYTFPPSRQIGGRRWAKFSQHLRRLGHDVTVICANDPIDKSYYDKEFSGIEVKVLPKCYPEWLTGNTNTFIEKLLYFVYTKFLSLLTSQNLFDRGYAWKKPMLKQLEIIHERKPIDVLIVTGAPFSLLYYGAVFKKRHNDVWYVADWRDPWTWGSYYGIPKLSPKKKEFQVFSERAAVEACDMMVCPTQNMLDVLSSLYPACSKKAYLLPHAYEPDRFPSVPENINKEGFIYGGTLYNGIESYIKKLAAIVKENPNSGFKWDIYTGTPYPLLDTLFDRTIVHKHGLVPEEELFKKICVASAYLAIFPETDKDLVSTKFFEIIYAGTPILYIGEEGEVSRFVRENKVGVHILPENMELELPKYLNGEVPFEKGYFDVSQYSFSRVTEKFVRDLVNYRN